jgi:3-oxoacyl-[acyl-carrier-protein] synthase II
MNKHPHQRFVITGMGTCNSLGLGVDQTFEKLFDLKCPSKDVTSTNTRDNPAMVIHRAFEYPNFDTLDQEAYSPRESKTWPKLTKAVVLAVDEAVKQANIQGETKVASLISSIGGGNDVRYIVESAYLAGKTKANPFHALGIAYDYSAGVVASKYGWNGPSTVLDSACATGLYTIDYAIKCLIAGDCEIAVAAGTDAMADNYNMYFFQVLRALSRRDEDYISQPFSVERDGFIMGEGAGAIVIETLEHAQSRGATILAEICGIGFYTETTHPTSPSENGEGATAAAHTALTRSGLTVDDIGIINAHATSTPTGDVIEYNAMNALFPKAVITSHKGHLGHTMSATGIIETIYGIKSLQAKTITPVANFTNCDFEKELVIAKTPTHTDSKYFIKNSYGFGGKCSSMIVGLYEKL